MEVKGDGDWALAGKEVAMAYIKPEYNWTTMLARLQILERRGGGTFIGRLDRRIGCMAARLPEIYSQTSILA